MTNSARSLAQLAGSVSHRFKVASLALLACVLVLGYAAPAEAAVSTFGETTVGLQPRDSGTQGEGSAASFENETGDAVLHGTSIYTIYWDPEDVFHEHHEWLTGIDHFMQQLGASSGQLGTIFAALAQYRDRTNVGASDSRVWKGSYHDFAKYPTSGNCADPNPMFLFEGELTCLTDAQLREQLQTYVAEHGLPKGMNSVYYLMLPPGVTVCVAEEHCSDYVVSEAEAEKGERKSTSWKNSFCSYHGAINPGKSVNGDANTILYGAIPWTAGTLGLAGFSREGFTFEPLFYNQGFDCQDGGWNVEGGKLKREVPKAAGKTEEEILKGEKGTPEEKAALEKKIRLENAHQQEPNQEGKGEIGDYSAGLADLTINQIAMEQADIVTDPLFASWKDGTGHEVTEICHDIFGNTDKNGIEGSGQADPETEAGFLSNETIGDGRYYVNNVYSAGESHCAGAVGLVPRFTAPDPVNSGETVSFNGMGSTVSLLQTPSFPASGPPTETYATFAWNFGDGTEAKGFAPGSAPCEAPWLSPCAGSVFHTYAYGGTYEVTLTVTDVAGHVGVETHPVTVVGPPPPGSPGAAGGSGSGSGSAGPGSAGPGSGSGKGAGATPPGKPVASAALASRSLKNALKKGVAIGYSVNEQVTGHFEVLMSRKLAHKLKIGGTPALGLPAGTPPQLVIAKAILVTTKGGRSVVHVKLPKKVVARLRHAHRAPLMLRLIVRNAASTHPETTTVISSATLAG